MDRPALQKLLDDVRARKIDVISLPPICATFKGRKCSFQESRRDRRKPCFDHERL